jgi:hypothetical protein
MFFFFLPPRRLLHAAFDAGVFFGFRAAAHPLA